METVFVLQHVRVAPSGEEHIKTIGVYRSSEAAKAAIERLKTKPGFCDAPRLLDPMIDDEESGFYLDQYQLDEDHWTEGFGFTYDS